MGLSYVADDRQRLLHARIGEQVAAGTGRLGQFRASTRRPRLRPGPRHRQHHRRWYSGEAARCQGYGVRPGAPAPPDATPARTAPRARRHTRRAQPGALAPPANPPEAARLAGPPRKRSRPQPTGIGQLLNACEQVLRWVHHENPAVELRPCRA
jgi:hypothetical protein